MLFSLVQEDEEANSEKNLSINHQTKVSLLRQYGWWLQMIVLTIFVLSGQSAATILGRLYYDKGGNSKWMATLVQVIGFPVLVPFLFLFPNKKTTSEQNLDSKYPSLFTLVSLYLFLGIFLAADCMLYSVGLLYLPVSTYTLICAGQLGFNAFFSYFLNSQKFTPFIINSLILLTISSVLLVFQPDSNDSNASKGKYALGFFTTVGASAGYGLFLSVTQLALQKILKKETFRVVLEMIIYRSIAATGAIVIGLFASGEARKLRKEMEDYKLGKISYVMVLFWIAVSWKIYAIGLVGLIFKVSSVFSNAISTFGLPIVPVLAVFIFNDKMNGVKVISMLLAIWGFVSYIYQHYLDDLKSKDQSEHANQNHQDRLIS